MNGLKREVGKPKSEFLVAAFMVLFVLGVLIVAGLIGEMNVRRRADKRIRENKADAEASQMSRDFLEADKVRRIRESKTSDELFQWTCDFADKADTYMIDNCNPFGVGPAEAELAPLQVDEIFLESDIESKSYLPQMMKYSIGKDYDLSPRWDIPEDALPNRGEVLIHCSGKNCYRIEPHIE